MLRVTRRLVSDHFLLRVRVCVCVRARFGQL